MILDWFSFFKTRFLNQKDHVVKCLGHRHRPFLLVEKKGTAVLPWPGGSWEPAAWDSCSEDVCENAESASKGVDLSLRLCSPHGARLQFPSESSFNCHLSDFLLSPSIRGGPNGRWISQCSFHVLSGDLK